MGKITKIEQQKGNPNRVSIFINGFCMGAEKRIIENLKLKEGMEIRCDELYEKINLYWKEQYKEKWKEEKERIDRVINKIKSKLPELKFEIFGFGADTDEMIRKHPTEKGIPDILIIYEKNNFNYVLTFLEITGTQQMKETDNIWIRPDKFEFARNHPHLDIFIAHYINNLDLLRFVSTKNMSNLPEAKETKIRGKKELYIKLPYNHELIITLDGFIDYLKKKIENINVKN